MTAIHDRAISKAISILDALGSKYHVVLDGTTYGSPIGQKPKKSNKYPGLTDYIRLHLKDIQKGEMRYIPATDAFPLHPIQSCTTTVMSHTYGNGSYMTTRAKDKASLEVLRIV